MRSNGQYSPPMERRISSSTPGTAGTASPNIDDAQLGHPTAGSSAARFEHAELVSLGIAQHNPGHVALTDIYPPCPEGQKPINLGLLVRSMKIQVQPILARLG